VDGAGEDVGREPVLADQLGDQGAVRGRHGADRLLVGSLALVEQETAVHDLERVHAATLAAVHRLERDALAARPHAVDDAGRVRDVPAGREARDDAAFEGGEHGRHPHVLPHHALEQELVAQHRAGHGPVDRGHRRGLVVGDVVRGRAVVEVEEQPGRAAEAVPPGLQPLPRRSRGRRAGKQRPQAREGLQPQAGTQPAGVRRQTLRSRGWRSARASAMPVAASAGTAAETTVSRGSAGRSGAGSRLGSGALNRKPHSAPAAPRTTAPITADQNGPAAIAGSRPMMLSAPAPISSPKNPPPRNPSVKPMTDPTSGGTTARCSWFGEAMRSALTTSSESAGNTRTSLLCRPACTRALAASSAADGWSKLAVTVVSMALLPAEDCAGMILPCVRLWPRGRSGG